MAGYAEGVEEVRLKNSEDSYGNQGIAMFSTGGQIDNYSDLEGTYYNNIRILWTAINDGNGSFASGSGLTGKGWFNDAASYPGSPLANYTTEQIYDSVFGSITPGNLNHEFSIWANNESISDDVKNDFVFNVLGYASGCVDITWGDGQNT